jgi:tyrosyl-tRNA synthetase
MKLRDDLAFRGLVHQVTDDQVLDQLSAGGLTVYIGFDPTAASFHVGHLVPILLLRRLQDAGNCPIAVVGGGTGLIGDPSFKDTERPLLTLDQLRNNITGIRSQLERFLDFSPSRGAVRAKLVDNSTWLTTISLTDFLRDVGKHFTVNQMIAQDAIRTRLERPDVGISFTEFSYLLMQSYDFLRLHVDHGCTVQAGGSDQWGNIVGGVSLIRRVTGHGAFGFTHPLLTRADGSKFGKSDGSSDHVWLDAALTSPFQMHQSLLNTEDEAVGTMLRWFTLLSHDEITALDDERRDHPAQRTSQRALANAIVTLVHGAPAAESAERAGRALFSETIADLDLATLLDVVADAPTSTLSAAELGSIDVPTLLVRTQLASSKGEARRFLDQGGVYLNNVRLAADGTVTPESALHQRYLVLRRGARQTHLLVLA